MGFFRRDNKGKAEGQLTVPEDYFLVVHGRYKRKYAIPKSHEERFFTASPDEFFPCMRIREYGPDTNTPFYYERGDLEHKAASGSNGIPHLF